MSSSCRFCPWARRKRSSERMRGKAVSGRGARKSSLRSRRDSVHSARSFLHTSATDCSLHGGAQVQ